MNTQQHIAKYRKRTKYRDFHLADMTLEQLLNELILEAKNSAIILLSVDNEAEDLVQWTKEYILEKVGEK